MSENLQSLLRNILTIVGGFFIGKNFLGLPVDSSMIEGGIGVLLAIGGIVWGIKDKTVTIEMLQSTARHILSTIGGVLIAAGKFDPAKLDLWIGLVTALIPIIYGALSKQKTVQLKKGEIHVHQLKGKPTK